MKLTFHVLADIPYILYFSFHWKVFLTQILTQKAEYTPKFYLTV